MIEVERRVLLTKKEMESLKNFFNTNGKFVKDFKRFTLVNIGREDFTPDLNDPLDLRVRMTKDIARLTVKYGNWHTDAGREEYEVEFNVDNLKELLGILKIMGRNYYSLTYIHRYQYEYKGFDITFDDYSFRDDCLMEVELGVEKMEESEEADRKITEFIKNQNLEPLSKDGFIKFVQENNDIMELRVDFNKITLDDWFEKWKDYIYCKV